MSYSFVHAIELSNFSRRLRLLAIGHLQLVALVLGLKNLADIGQRESQQIPQVLNALQALNIFTGIAAVIALCASGGREQTYLLVIAQRALGQAGLCCYLFDSECGRALCSGSWIFFCHHTTLPRDDETKNSLDLHIQVYHKSSVNVNVNV